MDSAVLAMVAAAGSACATAIVAMWRNLLRTQAELVERIRILEANRDEMSARSIRALERCGQAIDNMVLALNLRPCAIGRPPIPPDDGGIPPMTAAPVSDALVPKPPTAKRTADALAITERLPGGDHA